MLYLKYLKVKLRNLIFYTEFLFTYGPLNVGNCIPMQNQYVLQTAWSHMGLGACPNTHWARGDSLALLQVANPSQSNTQTLSHT